MHVTQINYAYDASLTDPDALLHRYVTLTGWSEALRAAGAKRVSVVQRFGADAVIERNGVEYIFRAARRPFYHAAAILGADILHVNGLVFPRETWILRRTMPRTAIVVQDHATGDPPRHLVGRRLSIRRAIWKAGLGAADAFFFTAAAQADPWKAANLIQAHQPVFDVLESSTELKPQSRADARAATGISGAPAVLWVGRLNTNKDPMTVLSGFEVAAAALPEATLTVVYGADDLLAQVRARVDASPILRSRVRLVGVVPHEGMAAYFSAADVFVLGSHHESCGYALLEACACGVVPVVTDILPFRAVTGGATIGALWRVDDPADLARALVGAWSRDIDQAKRNVRDHFAAALSWKAVGCSAMLAYAEIAAARRLKSRVKL